ncbi:hypothetical protein HPB47_015755 [Ixodes persulcatus]|uniref:Uncharacterized protein n=1 Tax=Ixodes persulcatus TaxID=34615 RepID=A0AC60QW83_IXOPE|nr:hypothetical protein HPB47_015755 [Ixodes persulcatus]
MLERLVGSLLRVAEPPLNRLGRKVNCCTISGVQWLQQPDVPHLKRTKSCYVFPNSHLVERPYEVFSTIRPPPGISMQHKAAFHGFSCRQGQGRLRSSRFEYEEEEMAPDPSLAHSRSYSSTGVVTDVDTSIPKDQLARMITSGIHVAQPTVCRVVERVSRLIAGTLFRRLVKFPSSATDFDCVMLEFYALRKFPGVTGPSRHPSSRFMTLWPSWPGFVHDSRIFDNSRTRVLYEHQRVPGVLLGEAGYACTTDLMTPLVSPGAAKSPEESSREMSDSSSFSSRKYQKAHIRTRNSVEQAFGVWKRRFPCLDMRLQHKPERSAVIITACAALHNLTACGMSRVPHLCPLHQFPLNDVKGSPTCHRLRTLRTPLTGHGNGRR